MRGAAEETEQTKIHLTRDDYLLLVCWMENPAHFAMIHGCEKKTTVGANTTKLDAFKQLAEHLHTTSKTPGLKLLSAESMKRRWNTYKSKFTKTLNIKRSETGMGLTQTELKSGLSIPAKLDKMCPHFARMESLFGEKHNVDAAATLELGAVETSATSETEHDATADEESQVASDSDSDEEQHAVSNGESIRRVYRGVEHRGECNPSRAVERDRGISTEGVQTINEEEPEFRFDSYSLPPEMLPSNTGLDVLFEGEQADIDQEAVTTINRLAIPDDVLHDLHSRLAAEPNSVGFKRRHDTLPNAASTATKNPSKKRAANKDLGSKKTSSKNRKTTKKRALRPITLTETDSESKSNVDQQSIAQGNRISITMAYAENAKARNDLFKRRLDQEENKENIRHVRWLEEQKAIKREQQAVRRHELLMALVQQDKDPQEIEKFLRIAGLEAHTPLAHVFNTSDEYSRREMRLRGLSAESLQAEGSEEVGE